MSHFSDFQTPLFNRRVFLEWSAMLGAGMLLPSFASGAEGKSSGQANPTLSADHYLTPVWLLHSVSRLAVGSRFMHSSLKQVLNPDIRQIAPGNAFLTASAMPFTLEALAEELEKRLNTWKTGPQHFSEARQLAVLTGAIVYRKMQPYLERAHFPEEKAASGVAESQIYQDAFLIRTWLTTSDSFTNESARELHSLFRQMIPRAFTRFHTLMPDEGDGAGWISRIAKWRKQTDLYLSELAAAVAQPDEEKIKRYVEGPGFSKAGEWLLVQVGPFNNIRQIDRSQVDAMLQDAKGGSLCAQSLAAGYGAVIAVSDYLSGQINPAQLKESISG